MKKCCRRILVRHSASPWENQRRTKRNHRTLEQQPRERKGLRAGERNDYKFSTIKKFIFIQYNNNINKTSKAELGRISKTHAQPRDFRIHSSAFFLKASWSFLHILAASIFAGLSAFGSASMEVTDRITFSMDCTGDHRSQLCS